ncbi:hypothetical protein [Acinetobacter sp. ANC 3832]|uniref:hypothetical protein n=1 Tax=Acinetobacter sp. ANC 3832 TaxID=1977874 RepID=UPI000A35C25D|nr:hypothetical protein [Acinetobacter sp. ANC 3832]OTG92608.1 hypothetical protein B9T35_13075 [Acinetobacter sp. ANC 3832]
MQFISAYDSSKSTKLGFRLLHIQVTDDCHYQVAVFDPNVIMAETEHENSQVLALAVQHWLGYGLIYPKLDQLDISQLQQRYPKIILLDENNPEYDVFTQYGQVVLDWNEYQDEVKKLVYHVSL